MIEVEEIGLILSLNELSQMVTRVGIVSAFRDIRLSYLGAAVIEPGSTPHCEQVMKHFPPTTLGQFESSDRSYTVEYSTGVRMKFSVMSQDVFERIRAKNEHPIGNTTDAPPLTYMELFRPKLSEDSKSSLCVLEIIPSQGISFTLPGSTGASWIGLGSSSIQDILSAMGSPDETSGEVFNFFRYGIDVKFRDRTFDQVEKIVLHMNQPDHPFFGRYKRSLFCILDSKRTKRVEEKQDLVTNQSTFDDLTRILGDPGPPVVVTHEGSGAVRRLYHFKRGLTFDVSYCGIAVLEISR